MADFSLLDWAVALLIAQAILGALDTIYRHELTVALPYRHSARLELSIHAMRSCFYGILFLGMAHLAFQGTWAIVIALLFALEICLTLWDFVVEDRSRKLPAIERIMHTVLAVNGGAFFALYGVQLAQWASLPTGLSANMPSMTIATPATRSTSASASATYSRRSGPPTRMPTYIR